MVAAFLLAVLGQSAPERLTLDTLTEVRRYATPTAEDLSFQSLDWQPTALDAMNESRKQDKPILLWLYFGDPRGHC